MRAARPSAPAAPVGKAMRGAALVGASVASALDPESLPVEVWLPSLLVEVLEAAVPWSSEEVELLVEVTSVVVVGEGEPLGDYILLARE
jgi:hypothetical protein